MNARGTTSELKGVFQSVENIPKPESRAEKPVKNSVIILAFYGVSCMGKTELVLFLRERARHDEITIFDISKDHVARPLMDAFAKQNPEVRFQDIYMMIYDNVEKAFCDAATCAMENLRPGKNILILDDAWANSKLIKQLNQPTVAVNYEKRTMCVFPKVSQTNFHGDIPFSLQFILNVCHRVVHRTDHETMVYDDVKKVQIVLSFIKLYTGVKSIPDKFQSDFNAQDFFPLEFHQESEVHHTSEDAPEFVRRIYGQLELCIERLGAPFETPFVQGKPEVEKLVELIQQIDTTDESSGISPFINFGRKAEWEKWYHKLSKYLS
jgi:hypothetical protein